MKIQLATTKKRTEWLRGLDCAVWLGLVTVVLLTISHHEPWSDEAQIWLLARDCGWLKLILANYAMRAVPGFGVTFSGLLFIFSIVHTRASDMWEAPTFAAR